MANLSFDDLIPQSKSDGRMTFDDLIPQANQPSTAMDVAKSVGSGAVEGTAGIIGQPRDIMSGIVNAGMSAIPAVGNKIRGFMGLDPLPGPTEQQRAGANSVAQYMTPWGSSAENVERAKPLGAGYEPQTTAGKYGKTVGEFLPSAAMGAEGLSGVPAALFKYGVAPGLASEAAGQATSGTAAEPYARVAGALAGNVAANIPDIISNSRAVGKVIKNAPTEEALQQRAKDAYRIADESGAAYSPQSYLNTVADLDKSLNKIGIDKELHPESSAVLGRLEKALSDKPKTFTELDMLRQLASDAAGAQKPADAKRGMMIRDAIDKLVDSGDAGPAANEARKNWSALRKSQTIGWEEERAGIQADRSGGGANVDNSLRSRMSALLLNNKGKAVKGFSQEEKDALREAVRGSTTQNVLRQVGRYSPENGPVATAAAIGSGWGAGSAALGPIGGVAGAVGLPIAGLASKRIADALSGRAVDYAAALVRSGANPDFVVPAIKKPVSSVVKALTQPVGPLVLSRKEKTKENR